MAKSTQIKITPVHCCSGRRDVTCLFLNVSEITVAWEWDAGDWKSRGVTALNALPVKSFCLLPKKLMLKPGQKELLLDNLMSAI